MGCGCGKNKRKLVKDPGDVMGGYKYLKPQQVAVRLEVFKKTFCSDCAKRYKCDYTVYLNCEDKIRPKMS